MTVEISDREFTTQNDDSEIVISVNNVSKKFCRDLKTSLFYGVQDIATDLIGGKRKSEILRKKEFWALKEVNFQLRRGQAVGLIGANGAGKSTLLRIISGLIKPDTGSIDIIGRVAPLIALGAGFNPILTGRENIYANMSILGLPTREIKKRFEEVVDFAEIWEAIDAPVQSYSSGMAARLGFACAVYVEPEILLIDEVLAVGDIKFKMKCHRRLAKLREQGTAFVLVSHNPHNVMNVCDRSVYLTNGQLIMEGDTEVVIRKYEEDLCLSGTEIATGEMILPEKLETESLGLDILALSFKDANGQVLPELMTGEPAYLSIECKSYKTIEDVNVKILVKALSGEHEMVLYVTSDTDGAMLKIVPGQAEIQMQMPFCGLTPGVYRAKIYVRQGEYAFDGVESFRFTVKSERTISRCLYYQPRSWQIIQ